MIMCHSPATLEEALVLRATGDVVVLAGGTDIFPARATRAAWGDPQHKDVLDISRLHGLRGITQEAAYWRIGALTTWTDLTGADLPPLFDGIKRAAHDVGGMQIQNRGTLVGNICTASPAGDGIPNLLVLDASVELASVNGHRVVPVSAFVDGYRHTLCGADEIVTAILVPKRAPGVRGHFLKLGARRYLVISIVMVAGVIELDHNAKITSASIAIGACSAVPQRVPSLEHDLGGLPLTTAADAVDAGHFSQLKPIDDIRASAAYRRHAALTLTRDLLAELAATATRGAS